MSAHSREPENLPERIARAQYHEAEILARREREAEGCRQWAEKHKGQQTLRIDRSSPRDRTVSDYHLFAE